jgi:S1-C subfamily serine protease
MPTSSDWELPLSAQPRPEDCRYDLDRALEAIVGLKAEVPEDAFTADTLGTVRTGNGVMIRSDGIVLTIGYLITEAESVWLHLSDGRILPGHPLGFDQQTGFGLVQVLDRGEFPCLPLGNSEKLRIGDSVVVAGGGGRSRSVAAHVVAKQEFAGYWEYLLDEAIFTSPSHPNWGGTAVLGANGELVGIGSLQVEQAGEGRPVFFNMVVPIDLLKPVIDDLLAHGQSRRPARPWLGIYATEVEERVVIAGLAANAPARRAGLATGDLVLAVAGNEVRGLAEMYRHVWSLGQAGIEVPLLVYREGRTLPITVRSGDRTNFLRAPHLH